MVVCTRLVEDKGNRHEKQGNTAEERVAGANTELREELTRLKHSLRLVTEDKKCAQLLTKSGKEAPNEARKSADPENMDAGYAGYEMPR